MRMLTLILAALTWPALCAADITIILPDGQTVTTATSPAQVQTKDGLRLVGVDMAWYAPAPSSAAEPLSDDDRKQIQEICTVPSFYDRCEILLLQGNADRAVGLTQLVRDRDFHAGKGEVIWRAELWYFEFQNGGWAKVSQQNKVLDRQRFASREKLQEYLRPIRFVPKLAGVSAGRVELTANDLIAPRP